jgi:tryptophan-rich sensory protein
MTIGDWAMMWILLCILWLAVSTYLNSFPITPDNKENEP